MNLNVLETCKSKKFIILNIKQNVVLFKFRNQFLNSFIKDSSI